VRIGIEINGVLRDTLKKISEVYEKWYIENPYRDEESKGEIISELNSLEIMKHLKFKDEDELYNFLYKEYTMEIFGHAGSVEYNGMNDLNDFYIDMRDRHDIMVVSDEMGKSKPASLFFLSKFGCLIEKVKFYSNQTINSMWDEIDILLTSNPDLILNHPDNKHIIKYNTDYNKEIKCDDEISSIKELSNKLNQIINNNVKNI
jgi:hypothetical protein